MRRGQLSLSLVEASVGALILLAVATSFAVVSPGEPSSPARLDVYAGDLSVVLTTASDDGPALDASLANEAAFDRNRSALAARAAGILPANVLYRIETPHGSVGYDPPLRRPAGVERVGTRHGVITVRVWYA